ncbi:hypothetical protein L210DRAFT_3552421 [Boletus edulis BED1]|uniref:BHLH domain-containing protein n=1 Tax=Boletus edulis BED1 TaxID=1328754 RepID=A0AAD4BMF5_BOLED|nr:hypothetical protein L210DRAFT_3552421 [Boletus edulis BED1]
MSATESDSADNAQPDFVLDPSDPLYMLLNNTHDAEPDAPFGFSFNPMDIDPFSVYVDPNALFIDGKAPIHSTPAVPLQPQDLLNPSFSFSFSSPTLSSASASAYDSPPGFSISSPSSSSSARASPAAPAVSRSPADAVSAFFSQPNPLFVAPFQSNLAVQQPLPPSAPPPAHATRGPQTHVINTAVAGRPKTSHTTIERRYRTNLNARIQSLKAAVPALRVLDQNYKNDEYKADDRGYIDGVKVARKGSKANVLGKAVEYIRVLKRREARLKREQDGLRSLICRFPGGQMILCEWEIEWTKKFGGPEKDEIDNEGAEEASDDEDGDGDGEDDGDTSERARKKPKVESSKKEKRKLAPAAPITAGPGPVGVPGVVEKRKRGRPRKIQPSPSITPAAAALLTDPGHQGIVVPPAASQSTQPQQYLLAVFALFSFFNSPLTYTSQPVSYHHTHQGSVLSHATSSAFSAQPAIGWTWNDVGQVVHLLASLAVFISIVLPWAPVPRRAYQSRLMQLVPFASLIYPMHASSSRETSDLPTPPDSPDASDSGSEPDSSSTEYTVRATKELSNPLIEVLSSRGTADEFDNLLTALNISSGWFGMFRGSVGAFQVHYRVEPRRERRARARLAELIVLASERISMSVRWQVYSYLSHHLGPAGMDVASDTLVSDLCTLALLAQSLPFSESRSQTLWSQARGLTESVEVSAYQRLVLDSMTVEEAMECLSSSEPISGSSPIELLASTLLRKRLHSHASSLFIHRVSQDLESKFEFPPTEDPKTWSATLSYCRSLGGDISLLSDALAKVWQDGWFGLDISDLKVDAANEDVLALLRAMILYSQVFASQSVPSPPPSPPSKAGGKESRADVVLDLHRVLGSNVFEESRESNLDGLPLEDARDRVVDMLVNLQRERRTRVGCAAL